MIAYGVYIHARPNREAFYVGKGSRRRAFDLKQRNKHHRNVVSKYGVDNIIVGFVPCENNQSALVLEIEWIKMLKLFGAKLTNQTDGGEGLLGFKHNAEVKFKMSIAQKGIPKTEGHKAALCKAWETRQRATEETRAKISSLHKGRAPWNKGKKLSEEYRTKLSIAQKKRWSK